MSRFRSLGVVAVVGLAALVLVPHLGRYALWDPDEARHAEVARETFTAGSWHGWIVPSLDFRPYHDKPMLFYWLVSVAYAVGGVCEAAARSVPAIAATLTALVVQSVARRAWDAGTGLAAAAVLLTAIEFAGLGRYADLNMTLTLWVTLGLASAYRWTRAPSVGPALVAAAAAAAGMLTKGLVAPVLVIGIPLVHLVLTGRLALARRVPWARAALVFLLVAGPWYVTAGLLDPAYLRDFFVRHHVERFVSARSLLHAKSVFFYLPIVIGGFFPWSLLLPATVSATLARGRRGDAETFCACWALGVLAFFTLSSGKLGTYILPAFPPLALLTGRLLGRIAAGDVTLRDRRLLRAGLVGIALTFLAATPGLLAVAARFHAGAWRPLAWLALILVPFAGAILWLVYRDRSAAAGVVVTLGMVTVIFVFYRWAAPRISEVQSEAPLARAIAAAGDEAAVAPILAYSVRTPSLLFYLGRRVEPADRPEHLVRALAEHPLVFVVTSARHVPDLEATRRLWPWRTGGHHLLYASRPLHD
ncbi:MAG: glycosyltransferase family 39 protein [Candidatus Binatia bacterium]